MTAEFIKQKAKELGAAVCGIGNVELLRGEDPQRNPFSILPNAKSIIGFGIKNLPAESIFIIIYSYLL